MSKSLSQIKRESVFARFRERSHELEHLDKGDYTSAEYEGCLIELRRINKFSGDARALRRSLFRAIEKLDLKTFSVVDVGAGSGELLRTIAHWARTINRKAQPLIGIELNARSSQAIRDESALFPEIKALRGDALSLPLADDCFDYAICSLFTHHFRDEDVIAILTELNRVARRGIFIIDLHRHPIAYYFYTTIGRIFLHNRLIREDGALSIRRSFRPRELRHLAERAKLMNIEVRRRFPYRLVLSARKDGQ
jgi:SAM-dependent methyltransferase